jgi:hypothetical protein
LRSARRKRYNEIALQTVGHPVPVTASWGATETGPAVTTAHFDFAPPILTPARSPTRVT